MWATITLIPIGRTHITGTDINHCYNGSVHEAIRLITHQTLSKKKYVPMRKPNQTTVEKIITILNRKQSWIEKLKFSWKAHNLIFKKGI